MSFLFDDFSIAREDVKIMFNICLGVIAGVAICAGYILGNKNRRYSKNFVITILLLPVIMTVLIPFVATDLKKAVSLAGIFALVRFRSIPADSKDIFYVFFSMAVGIVLGMNTYTIAFVLIFVVSVIFVALKLLWKEEVCQILKITIPEDMNYNNVFDDVFEKYLLKHTVKNVKTTNMGSLFIISYNIQIKKDADVKAFIDELRTRNGNLNIIIENDDMSESML